MNGSFKIKNLTDILSSSEYRKDLEDLSSYAANIKQERQILYFLAKHLNKQGFNVVLEKKISGYPCDLVVNDTKIEAKFYYECDLKERLEKELNKTKGSIEPLVEDLKKLKEMKKGTSWNMALAITKDILDKAPDIFMLVILSRDLGNLKDQKILDKICWSSHELRYSKYNDEGNLGLVDKFFNLFKEERPFDSDYYKIDIEVTMDTKVVFPSSYHFFFLRFRTY